MASQGGGLWLSLLAPYLRDFYATRLPFYLIFARIPLGLRVRTCAVRLRRNEMTFWMWLGGLGALALAVYLLYALLNAEKF